MDGRARSRNAEDQPINAPDAPRKTDIPTRYVPPRELGRRFRAASVAELYRYRPRYSEEVFAVLGELLKGQPSAVLDAGCGPGKIARELVGRVERVDAVDASAEMIEMGRSSQNGHHPALRWLHAPIEEAPLQPPYGLVTAGASFHWFDADLVLPRLAAVLAAGGFLALIEGDAAWKPEWADAERELMIDFVGRMTGKRPGGSRGSLEEGLLLDHPRFERIGMRVTAPCAFEQAIDEYIACQHSRATFTPEAMGVRLATEFDQALRDVLVPHADDGRLHFDVRTRIDWGLPR